MIDLFNSTSSIGFLVMGTPIIILMLSAIGKSTRDIGR